MLLHEITNILAVPAGEGSKSTLPVARLEHVLTSGYAHALALEGERLRLERRLGDAARRLAEGSEAREEVSALVASISSAEDDLIHLRALLEPLRDRARAARRAA
jgi:hypothetical protein